MAVSISRGVLEAVLADARLTPERERCGLLLGEADRVLDWAPAANVHPLPERHFELDPAVLIAAERRARMDGGLAVLGHYHSHPNGPAAPSASDADAAMPDGRLWLIVNGEGFALWRSISADGAFNRAGTMVFDRFAPEVLQVDTR